MTADQRQLEHYGQPMVQQQLRPVFRPLPGRDESLEDKYEPLREQIIVGLGLPPELVHDRQQRQ